MSAETPVIEISSVAFRKGDTLHIKLEGAYDHKACDGLSLACKVLGLTAIVTEPEVDIAKIDEATMRSLGWQRIPKET